MNRIRICRVIARLNEGGAARHVIQLTAGLDSQRFDQRLVTGVEGPHEASLAPEARARGLRLDVVPELGREVSARHDAVTLWKLYRLFREWRPHIVETHTAKAGTLGRLAALLARTPVRVHVFHGHVFHGYFGPARSRAFLEIERALARATTRIVALGEEQRRELLSYGVGRPPQVISIPLGLRLSPFLDTPAQEGALRAELGLSSGGAGDAPLLGMVGRLAPIKAHEVFLAGAARILDAVPQAHFVVVGDGERRAELEALAARAPLAGRVHFLGWCSNADLPAIYAGLDLVLLTSDNEGLPVSVIEAMAAARPVVSADVGGVRTLVADGETGLLVPRRDPQALADACVRLIRDPERRRRLGEAARRAVYPRYDLSTLLSTMAGFYTRLHADAAQGRRRTPAGNEPRSADGA